MSILGSLLGLAAPTISKYASKGIKKAGSYLPEGSTARALMGAVGTGVSAAGKVPTATQTIARAAKAPARTALNTALASMGFSGATPKSKQLTVIPKKRPAADPYYSQSATAARAVASTKATQQRTVAARAEEDARLLQQRSRPKSPVVNYGLGNLRGSQTTTGGQQVTSYNQPPPAVTSPAVKQAVGTGLGGLVESYNQAYGEAKLANEQRYAEMLGIADEDTRRQRIQHQEMLGLTKQTTGQRAADIESDYARQQASEQQRLARVGMAGTTAAPTMREGIERYKQSALNRLADEMQGTQLGVMGRIAGEDQATRLGIMERREDTYPNQAMITQMLGSIGSGQKGDLLPSIFGALGNLGRTPAASPSGAASAAGAGVGGFQVPNLPLIAGKGFGAGQSLPTVKPVLPKKRAILPTV